jgi:SAM-dependent methyltransferase
MSDKKEITDKVQKMYTQFPFPDVDCRMDYGLTILRFLKGLDKKRPNFWQTAKVMEAGCGTGNTLNHLAKIFSEASFLGVDLTPASLAKAHKKATEMELKNIKFQQENILELDLEEKKFDVILCIGVLHHTADMMKGIKRLKSHLADDGVLILWLYGKYGRFRLNLNQRFFDLLLANVDDLNEKVEIAKKVLTLANKKDISCHLNVHSPEIENDWDKTMEFVMKEPQWLVDQFLHVNEKVVDMEDILALADGADLQMTKWFNVKNDLDGYINDTQVQSLYEKLEEREKLLVKDLLLKPDYYTVALEQK